MLPAFCAVQWPEQGIPKTLRRQGIPKTYNSKRPTSCSLNTDSGIDGCSPSISKSNEAGPTLISAGTDSGLDKQPPHFF